MTELHIEKCIVDAVSVGKRLRSVDSEKVAALAESINAIGLRQPISVWSPDADTLDLVAGLHRLEAFKKLRRELPDEADLRWDEIPCIFVDMDDLDRQLWEIDENLCRSELGPAEMAEHLKRRKELWEEREKKVAQVEPPSGQKKGFATDTEKKTGTSKATTNRAVARATAIPADVLGKIKGTELDTGVYLDKLKKLTRDEMREMVDRDLEAVEEGNFSNTKDVHEVLPEAEGKRHKKRRTKAEIRLDEFDHAIQAVSNMCSGLRMIDVPNLDSKRLSRALADLRNAVQQIQYLIESIQNARDENQAP